MKFIAPEVEIKRFDVADVLTASAGAGEPDVSVSINQQLGTYVGDIEGGPCTGTAADDLIDECI